jgi:hypothetical protein
VSKVTLQLSLQPTLQLPRQPPWLLLQPAIPNTDRDLSRLMQAVPPG